MAEGLCPGLCLETGVLILSGSTVAFQELKGGAVFNKGATRKQAPLNTRTKEVFKFQNTSVEVFQRGTLIGGGFFPKSKKFAFGRSFKKICKGYRLSL